MRGRPSGLVVALRIPLAVVTLALAALASPSSAEAPDIPVETHCVADETGAAHCSTTVAGACTLFSANGDHPSSSAACSHAAIGYCSVGLTPVQDLPNAWCESYPPPGDGSASASADPTATQPCQAGFAQTWCDFTVGPCDLRVTPWTAWGDQSVVSDCRTGGAGPTCHTEVHAQGPLAHEHWCAF